MNRFAAGIATFLFLSCGMITFTGEVMAVDSEDSVTEATLPSLVVSATRYEMPQSQITQDITVITREDMSHLPVHDVGEALNYIPGLVLDRNGGPGSFVFPSIQGSDDRQVKILIDDIPLEMLSGGLADFSMLPIENVERVEVLKGSASSVWGSSLGGVINIITSKPSDAPTGEVGISTGEENTRKFSGLLSGKSSGVGYVLTASRYETDGFFKNTDSESNSIYAKLTKEIGNGLSIEASYGHNNITRGFGVIEVPEYSYFSSSDNKNRDSFGRVKLGYSNKRNLDLSLSLYDRVFYYNRKDTDMITGETITYTDREDSYGAVFKTGWRHSDAGILSAGAEASHGTADLNTEAREYDTDRRALYLNESYHIGNLDFNAGARFDDDYAFGSEFSPSAGAVYNIKDAFTLIRVNVARGFTPPPIFFRYYSETGEPNKDLSAERAWTYQAGIETRAIPGLWSKVTFYRTDIEDAVDTVYDDATSALRYFKNIKKFRRQGVEVEARTSEYRGLSFSYGYAFNDVRDLDSDQIVKNKARVTHDIGLDYRGPFETKTTVKGHYVYWNADESLFKAKDNNFIWDAKVSKYLARWKAVMGEIFVSAHNIFSEKQYLMEIYPNPGTWWEGGVSLTFY